MADIEEASHALHDPWGRRFFVLFYHVAAATTCLQPLITQQEFDQAVELERILSNVF